MKRIFLLSLMLFISRSIFSQSSGSLTEDEKTRIKIAVHLITYDTVGTFDNAAGEAYYNLVISSFKENFSIPQFNLSSVTQNDKKTVERYIQLLNQAKQKPPTWDDLLIRQTQYQIWLDKALHKKSKYKTETPAKN